MQIILPTDVRSALDRKQSIDPAAGIYVTAPLSAATRGYVPMSEELDDAQIYYFYGARILGIDDGQPFVTPHLHLFGDEPYLFLDGKIEMNIGHVDGSEGTSNRVDWQPPIIVGPGDTWIIRQGEVHCARNLGKTPAHFIFACPTRHLEDRDARHPNGDRYVAKHLINGIPPHFPR